MQKVFLTIVYTEQYGRLWNDTERYGTIQNDTERYRTIRNDKEQYGTIQNNTERYRTIRNDTERYGTIWNNTKRYRRDYSGIQRVKSRGRLMKTIWGNYKLALLLLLLSSCMLNAARVFCWLLLRCWVGSQCWKRRKNGERTSLLHHQLVEQTTTKWVAS